MLTGEAVPHLDPSAEYFYFMHHPELERLRRLFRAVEKLERAWEHWEALSELPLAGGLETRFAALKQALGKQCELYSAFKREVELTPYGVAARSCWYAKAKLEEWYTVLKRLERSFALLRAEAALLL